MNWGLTLRLAVTASLLAILWPGTPDHGVAQAGLALSASAGYDGYCKENHWLPVRAIIENRGVGFDARLEIVVTGYNGRQTVYAREFSLPTVSRKELFVYVFPEGFLNTLTIQLVGNGQALAQQELPVTCAGTADRLYGVVSNDGSPFNLLAAIDPPNGNTLVAMLEPGDLPDHAASLAALDGIFVSGADTGQLSQAQAEALAAWVARGGRLIAGGGPGWEATLTGLMVIEGLLPLLPEGTQTVVSPAASETLPGLDLELPAGAILATGRLATGSQVLAELQDVPLVVRKSFGAGDAFSLAFDPGLEPVRSWPGLAGFYRELLAQPGGSATSQVGFQDWSLAATAAGTLSGLRLPPAGWIIAFLGLYVIAAGPANFLILRRLKRRELAWLSLPALVILFSSLAFAAGSRIRGQQVVVNRLAVVRAWPGAQQAQVNGLLGLFSPQRGSYELVVEAPFLAHAIPADPAGGAGVRMAFIRTDLGDTRLPDLRLDVGEIRTLALEGQLESPGIDPQLTLLIDEDGATLRGSIGFQEREPLQDAILIAAGKFQHLGDLQPGEQREVAVSIDSTSRAVYAPGAGDDSILWRRGGFQTSWDDLLGTNDYFRDAQTYRRFNLLNAVAGIDRSQSDLANGFILAGWSEASPLEVELVDQSFDTSDTTLYLVSLAPELSYAQGNLTVPPGLFTWSILDPGAGGEASPYETYISPGGFGLSFRPAIALPSEAIQSLTLHLESYGASGPAGLHARLWNFRRETWDPLADLEWGDIAIDSPGDFVGPGGEVRLQLDAAPGVSGQIERADFTLEVEG